MRFDLQYRAALLNKESHEEVEEFNQLLRDYRELTFPKIRDRRYEKAASEELQDITKLKITPMGKRDLGEF